MSVCLTEWCEYRWVCETCPRDYAYVDRTDRPPSIPMRCTTCEERMLLLVEPLDYTDGRRHILSGRRTGHSAELWIGPAYLTLGREPWSLHAWIGGRGVHVFPRRRPPFFEARTDRIGGAQ